MMHTDWYANKVYRARLEWLPLPLTSAFQDIGESMPNENVIYFRFDLHTHSGACVLCVALGCKGVVAQRVLVSDSATCITPNRLGKHAAEVEQLGSLCATHCRLQMSHLKRQFFRDSLYMCLD